MINIIMAFHHNHETKQNIIGNKGALPWPMTAPYAVEDLRRFRALTTGGTVVMGRKTYESIGKPLPNRHNIVITSSKKEIDGCEVIHPAEIDEINIRSILEDDAIWIIGGEALYDYFSDTCDNAYITQIHPDNGETVFEGDVVLGDWIDESFYLNDDMAIVDAVTTADSTMTHFRRKV